MTERSLLLDLYAAFHKSGQVVDRACAGTGIEPEDFAFVSIVGGREPVTPTAISREFGLSLSTVLFRATRNVELGFVERVTNPQDGRSFLLRLTPEGRRAWQRAGNNLREAVDSLDKCGIYFGTTGGQVYASADAGNTWKAIVRDLPAVLSVEVQTLGADTPVERHRSAAEPVEAPALA